MTQQTTIRPNQAVRTVLRYWQDLSPEQIGELAGGVWQTERAWDRDGGDCGGEADLLASLRLCKGVGAAADLPSLAALWGAVADGSGDAPFGGLARGRGSRNYAAARMFIETLFAPKVLELLEDAFNRMGLSAGRHATPAERAAAYLDAADALAWAAARFDFSDREAARLRQAVERKGDLLRQLADAEGGMEPQSAEPAGWGGAGGAPL